jgi:CheY-like chemotaxis protein
MAEPDLQGLSVLIVHGEEGESELIDGYLHSWGIATRTVSSTEEARTVLGGSPAEGTEFDVVIASQAMPGVNALRRRLHTEPALASTRLILLSGPEEQGSAKRGSEGGSVSYLSEPVEQPNLYNAIVNAALGLPQTVTAAEDTQAVDAPAARLVLLAEDNEPTQTMVLLQLQRLGYSAHSVSSGRQAVQAVSLAPSAYGLVLMDCQMPEMDGFAATMAIRELESRTGHHIPIVAMTAYATQHDREKCLAAGMDDYVSKPVTRDNLRQILDRWLKPQPEMQASPTG